MPYTLIAPCFFGTESTLAFEVRRLGAQNVQVSDGRVQFEGDAGLPERREKSRRQAADGRP